MKLWFQRRIAPLLGAAMIRLLGATVRLHIHDEYGFLSTEQRTPIIFAFWHNRLFLLPYLHQRLITDRKTAVMISRSRDGNLIADIVGQFDMYSARGSSSKRGSAALLDLVHSIEKKFMNVAITPDGPRGPRQKVQPGILYLSQVTSAPIIPVAVEYSSKWELKSWDRFQIPRPFTRCDLYFGKPIQIPLEADEKDWEAAEAELTRGLGK
jgi:lysophospholipid acyltransferase (LPLAT)-like uncharacterized protein